MNSPFAAATRNRQVEEVQSQWTWDLGAAAGSYGNYSYSEIDVGLNDHFTNFLNWRNVFWDRFGNISALSAFGLDTSIRYEFTDHADGKLGFHFFAGPGYRFASANFNGFFAEGGIVFRIGTFGIGGGVKDIFYSAPGTNPATGLAFPSSDLMYFIILSGGGAF